MRDKLMGGLYGLLIGDAVGTPYEFKSAGNIPPYDQIDMIPPEGYKKSWSAFPCGIWSDDGSQALCLLEYYTEQKAGDVWYDTWAKKLLHWQQGHLWVDGKSFDAGIQTRKALLRLQDGVHPLVAGELNEYANGNGSLMRTLPVALWNLEMPTAEFYQEVENISHITHPHPRSKLCCVLYCDVARELIHGLPLAQAIEVVETRMREHYSGDLLDELNIVMDGRFEQPQGTGYVVDALWSALWSVTTTSTFEDCIKTCIALGNDTDTTACIAGGLAGIIYGYQGIPAKWLTQLKGSDDVAPLAQKLLQHQEEKK